MENNKRNLEYNECYTDDEIDLYELFLILKKRKWIIIAITIIFIIGAIIYIKVAPRIYRSETTIMPLIGQSKVGIDVLPFMNFPLPIQDKSTAALEAILSSRSLKERIVEKLNLLPILFKDKWDEKNKKWILKEGEKPPTVFDGAQKLNKLITISTDNKTGVIKISVDFENDPKIPYLIANAILVETQNIITEKSFTLSKYYKEYLKKQILILKSKLEKLEKIYMKFLKGEISKVPLVVYDNGSYGITNKDLTIEDIENLKNKFYSFEKNIQRLRVRRDFINIQKYKFNLEKLNMQFNLLKGLFMNTLKEYELAKLKEKREEIQFQVIDEPYMPKGPYKPKKKLILAVSVISGLFLGIFAAFFAEWLSNIKRRGGSNLVEEKK